MTASMIISTVSLVLSVIALNVSVLSILQSNRVLRYSKSFISDMRELLEQLRDEKR